MANAARIINEIGAKAKYNTDQFEKSSAMHAIVSLAKAMVGLSVQTLNEDCGNPVPANCS